MILAGALVAGAATAVAAWLAARPVFSRPRFARANFRGRTVPTATGVVMVAALVWLPTGLGGSERDALLVVVAGLAVLGLLDDIAGSEDRGFRGHLAALRRGRVTTGMVKMVGGLVVALVAVWLIDDGSATAVRLADAALVALAANLGNLLDRAPGRTVKAGLLAFAVLVAAAEASDSIAGVALVAGAAAGMLPFDLRERLMLGDAGANALGGALGLGVVIACAPSVRLGVLAAVAVVNAASEVVSFSRVIDAVPPLRIADRFGRSR